MKDSKRSEEEWRKSLTPEQYRILREAGTEEGEGTTYSTETGEADVEGERKKRPARRKRRPKPEAIAARLKTEETPPAPEPVSGEKR